MNSVNDVFRRLVVSRYQYCDVKDAWFDFLTYLEKRLGADLRTFWGLHEVRLAWDCFGSGQVEILESPEAHDFTNEWFRAFNRRPDVLEALRKFCADRGIPLAFLDAESEYECDSTIRRI